MGLVCLTDSYQYEIRMRRAGSFQIVCGDVLEVQIWLNVVGDTSFVYSISKIEIMNLTYSGLVVDEQRAQLRSHDLDSCY